MSDDAYTCCAVSLSRYTCGKRCILSSRFPMIPLARRLSDMILTADHAALCQDCKLGKFELL